MRKLELPRYLQIVAHLNKHRILLGPGDYYGEAPYAATQQGIADALKMSRAHAALVLSRHPDLFDYDLMHIKGGKRRQNAYYLAPKGLEAARMDQVQQFVPPGAMKPRGPITRRRSSRYRDNLLVGGVAAAALAGTLVAIRRDKELRSSEPGGWMK